MKYKNSFNIVVKDLIPIPEFIKLVLKITIYINKYPLCSFHKQQIQCNHLQERQNGNSCSSGSVKITAVAISSTKKPVISKEVVIAVHNCFPIHSNWYFINILTHYCFRGIYYGCIRILIAKWIRLYFQFIFLYHNFYIFIFPLSSTNKKWIFVPFKLRSLLILTESNAYDNSVPSSQVIPPMLHNFVSTFSTIRTMMNIKL